MALFKILRGESSAFTTDLSEIKVNPPFVDGYCYFLPDTGMFYIDYDDGQNITSYVSIDIVKANFILPEGRTYYTFNFNTDMYEEYVGDYDLIKEYGGEDNLPTYYYYYLVSYSQHRIPLNANEAKAVQSIKELNKGREQKFWRGTKAEYDAIEEKDDNILYIITDEFEVIEQNYLNSSIYDPQNKQVDIYEYADNTYKTPKSGFILTDIVNGFNYAIQMVNGNLVSKLCIRSLEVTKMPNKTSYVQYELFDPTGMVVEVTYENGTVEEIDFYQYNRGVDKADFSIYYDQVNIVEDIIQLEVEPFNPEEVLIDFYYIDNGDGTYTITEWKHTLNGVPNETDMVVPNFTNIIVQ